MEKLTVQVIATISNQWVTTEYKWLYRNHFIAQQYIDSLRSIYGDRLQVLSVTDID